MDKEFNWDILFTLLRKKLIVPVIGSDIITIKGNNGNRISINDYLTQKLAERLGVEKGRLNFHEFILKYQKDYPVSLTSLPVS